MKKMTRKVLALMLMAVMTIAMASGCDKAEKSKSTSSDIESGTVFNVMKQMSEMEQISLETTLSMDNVDGVSGEVVIKVKRDKNKASLGLDINAAGMIFELDDLMIVDGNTLYLNVKEIKDEFDALLSSAEIDLSEYGITSDWLSLTLDGMPEDTITFGAMFDDLDKAYKEMFNSKKGVYTLTVEDEESYDAFCKATKKLLEDNKESWADMIVEYYGSFDVKTMAESLIDEVADKFADEIKDSLGEEMDENEIRDMIMDNIDMDLDEADIDKEDIVEALEDAAEELDYADYDDFEGTKVELTSKTEKGESVVSGKVSHGEGSVSFTMKATKDTSGIKVPSDADSMIDVLVDLLCEMSINSADDYYDTFW